MARCSQLAALFVVVLILSPCDATRPNMWSSEVSAEVTSASLHSSFLGSRRSLFSQMRNFNPSGNASADHWWAMRLALDIAQNQSRSTESTSLLNVSLNSSGSIPRILHTVMKDCSDPQAAQKLQRRQEVLLTHAADFQSRCYDHASMPGYVKKWMPQHADFFGRLPPFRADLFRLMALWHEGGFYADDDVVFNPGFLRGVARVEKTKPFVVGWERHTPTVAIGQQGCRDSVEKLCTIGEPRCMLCNSLAQWTFGAKQKHPLLLDLVGQIVDFLDHPSIKDLTDVDILQHTGPVMFSTRVLRNLHPSDVLGMTTFGCGQAYGNSPVCDPADESQWSKHLFEGKWRTAS